MRSPQSRYRRGKVSVEAVQSKHTSSKTGPDESLSSAESYCRIVDGDLIANDGGRRKIAIAIQHACGMQEKQNKTQISEVARIFYPPSLAWLHPADTQLLLKCHTEAFLSVRG